RLHDSVALGLPVVEACVAGAAVVAARAEMPHEVALGVGGLHRHRCGLVLRAHLEEERLVLRRVVDRLALLDLGVVLRLHRRIECVSQGRTRDAHYGEHGEQPTARGATEPSGERFRQRARDGAPAGSPERGPGHTSTDGPHAASSPPATTPVVYPLSLAAMNRSILHFRG